MKKQQPINENLKEDAKAAVMCLAIFTVFTIAFILSALL
jgi:hypothetical protein